MDGTDGFIGADPVGSGFWPAAGGERVEAGADEISFAAGDANCDAVVNAADVLQILDVLFGGASVCGNEDVNGDGVDDLRRRLASLLEVAVVRFAETRRLQQELNRAKTSLAERKTVDRAKGIIMQQRNVSEDQAYQLLRRLAMQRNRRIGEVAGEVIAAAEVLI
mgnify:CR=1 FL=1